MSALTHPLFTLAVQIAAIVTGALTLKHVAGAASVPRWSIVSIAVLLSAMVVPAVWGAAQALDDLRRNSLVLPAGVRERESCLAAGGNQWALPVARWLAERMPPDATYVTVGQLPHICLSFALLPRRQDAAAEPEFTIAGAPFGPEIDRRIRAERELPAGKRSVDVYEERVALVRER